VKFFPENTIVNEPPRPKGRGILLSISPSPLPSPVKGEGVLYFTHAASSGEIQVKTKGGKMYKHNKKYLKILGL